MRPVTEGPDGMTQSSSIDCQAHDTAYPRDANEVSEEVLRSKPEAPITPRTSSDELDTAADGSEKPQMAAQSESDLEVGGNPQAKPSEPPDEIYARFSPKRKLVMVVVAAWCGLLSPISSTTVLAAIPEVAASLGVTGSIIGISNALYIVFMALSPCFWGPLSQVYGRRKCGMINAIIYFLCSIGTALSPNIASFVVFRMLTAFAGTAFLVLGPAVIGDLYHPTERGTAMGWFLSGTLIGPTIGPLAGGIIVTYTSWRAIFWLQTALAGCAILGTSLLLCETIHRLRKDQLEGLPMRQKAKVLYGLTNPFRVLRLFRYPNLILVSLASGSLVWTQYGLLTPIRYVLNPRFSLTTPMQSGLFYLAPGLGYLVGTFGGGRWADHIVKLGIKKRNGQRVPEDRLYSCIPFLGILMPAEILVYGWCVQEDVGGIPVAVIFMFLQGISQSFAFPSLNVYCLDVLQERSAEIIAGNFMVRYLIGAVCSAAVVTATEEIGVGIFSTISAAFMIVATVGLCFAAQLGPKWRGSIQSRDESKGEGTTGSKST